MPTDTAYKIDQASEPARLTPVDGLSELLNAGRALLDGLAQSLKPNAAAQSGSNALIERDAKTGQAYLKLPMPSSQTVDKIVSFLRGLSAGN